MTPADMREEWKQLRHYMEEYRDESRWRREMQLCTRSVFARLSTLPSDLWDLYELQEQFLNCGSRLIYGACSV